MNIRLNVQAPKASLKRKVAQLFTVVIPLIKEEKEQFRIIEEYIDLGVGGLIIGMGGKIDFLTDFLQTNHVVDARKVRKITFRLKRLDPTLFLAIDGEGGMNSICLKTLLNLSVQENMAYSLNKKAQQRGLKGISATMLQ